MEIIRKYIIECPTRPTKNNVVDYMNSKNFPDKIRTSRVTTLGIISEMENLGTIKIIKAGERRGQRHYIIINDKNELNQIHSMLSEIDMFTKTIYELVNTKPNLPVLDLGFVEPINFMLQVLLKRVNEIIPYQNNSSILYTKIVTLMLTVTQLYHNFSNPKDYLKMVIHNVNSDKDWGQNKYIAEHAKINILDNFASTLQHFEKQFENL